MKVLDILAQLQEDNNLRALHKLKHDGLFIWKENKKLLNFASNDYLYLSQYNMYQEFLQQLGARDLFFSSSSSRSLSGNFEIYEELEAYIASLFVHKSCLLFNSGYHLNISCIQALSLLPNTLFVADKAVHASLIDGLRLGGARFKRYRHNNMQELQAIIDKNHKLFSTIIIISEGLFSMDGDFAQVQELVHIKKSYPHILLYLDEAHSVGAIGQDGLGLARYLGYDLDIDFLVFTFGKALCSVGACILCTQEYKDFFINKSRGLIYSTALPPINIAFSSFIFHKLPLLNERRAMLHDICDIFKKGLHAKGLHYVGDAHIVSLILGSNKKAVEYAQKLQSQGFFAPAIKEPTVPKGSARIRFSLNSGIHEEYIIKLIDIL